MTQALTSSTPSARTAFVAPSPPAGVALRAGVMDQLSAPGTRLAVVTAPGGYGKTSHLASWVAEDPRPAAWIDIEEAHGDPLVLLSALTEALAAITDFGSGEMTARGTTPLQLSTVVAPSLGQSLRRCTVPFVMVLDDAHALKGQSAADLLDAVAANVPEGSTVVIIGRAEPLASLPRLRVSAGVVELSAADLALDAAGVATALAELGVEPDPDRVVQVLAESEGWPVGVRFTGLAWLAELERTRGNRPGIDPRHTHVFEYIQREWLWGLSEDDHDFLMRVSALDWLSGPLCNSGLGRNDAGDVLHRIFNDRLIVIPLDRREEQYRMHGLLREALQAEFERVDAAGAARVHQRASLWFESVGDIDRAMHYAVAVGDLARAERLVVQHAPLFHTNGRYTTVVRWLDSIPRDYVLQRPSLCVCAALTTIGLGDGDSTAAWLRFGGHALASSTADDPMARLSLLTVRSVMSPGPAGPAIDDARVAHRQLPPGAWHAAACLAYGAWSWSRGDDVAAKVLAEGAEEAVVCGAPSLEANCRALLAMIAHSSGDVVHARLLARAARRVMVDHGLEPAPSLVLVDAISALAAAGAGETKAAHDAWMEGRRKLAYFDVVAGWDNVQSRIALAHASLLLGDRIGADTLMNELRPHLAAQPDAARAHRQVAELEELLVSSSRLAAFGPSSLSTAELRVLHYLPTNLSLAEIGDRLFISRFTVKTHCSSIYRKLGVSSRSKAVEVARTAGLLPHSRSGSN